MQRIYVSQYKELCVQIVPPKLEEINGVMVARNQGRKIKFGNGVYQTENAEEIALIEKSSSYGTDFFDRDIQKHQAEKAEAKIAEGAVGIVEGARTSDNQFKGSKPTTAASRSDTLHATVDKEPKAKVAKRGRPKKK